MGKIKQGILGGFKGKVGTVIGASWNGISYMRGIAQSVRNANTASQQSQRGFFRELLDLVGQFSNEQLEFLFPSTPKGMTRRNMLLQQFAEGKVIDGDTKTVDLTEVKTVGNAPTAELPAVTVTAAGENLTISWNGDTDARTAAAAEYPTVFVANTTKKRVFLVNSTAASVPLVKCPSMLACPPTARLVTPSAASCCSMAPRLPSSASARWPSPSAPPVRPRRTPKPSSDTRPKAACQDGFFKAISGISLVYTNDIPTIQN